MSIENAGQQFTHFIGGSLIKEAQDHVQAARDHLAQYTKPIYHSTPEETREEELWNHPLFARVTGPLSLASSSLDSAARFHDQGKYALASQQLIYTHESMRNAVKGQLEMAEKNDPKYPPIEDPRPLEKAFIGVHNSINEWHNLFKNLGNN